MITYSIFDWNRLGLIALAYSIKSSAKADVNFHEKARLYSRRALFWNLVSIIFAVISFIGVRMSREYPRWIFDLISRHLSSSINWMKWLQFMQIRSNNSNDQMISRNLSNLLQTIIDIWISTHLNRCIILIPFLLLLWTFSSFFSENQA